MFDFIKALFNFETAKEEEWIWCLIGNVVSEHEYGEAKKIVKGTKQFSGGTKLYCFPAKWGDGYEKIMVIGKPRKQRKLITIIIAAKYVCNWRLKKVFVPSVIAEMKNKHGWDASEKSKNRIEELAAHLNRLNPDTATS